MPIYCSFVRVYEFTKGLHCLPFDDHYLKVLSLSEAVDHQVLLKRTTSNIPVSREETGIANELVAISIIIEIAFHIILGQAQ
jgi:hypothetical protein